MKTTRNTDQEAGNGSALLKHLSAFIGYGSLTARVWFIGPEEHLEKETDEAIEADLRARETFDPVEDCRTAHIEKLGCLTWHGPEASLQPTWGQIAAIMIGLSGGDHESRNDRLHYQISCLGSRKGDTLLSELLPLPKPSVRSWPKIYSRMFGFETLRDYQRAVLPGRIGLLSGLIAKHKPSVVLCYGSGFWQDFKNLFSGAEFKPHRDDEMIQVGVQGETLVLLTPHFARGFFPKQRVEHVVRLITKARPSLQGELKCCPG